MACGNGADRTQHPEELLGPDWLTWGLDAFSPPVPMVFADDQNLPKPVA